MLDDEGGAVLGATVTVRVTGWARSAAGEPHAATTRASEAAPTRRLDPSMRTTHSFESTAHSERRFLRPALIRAGSRLIGAPAFDDRTNIHTLPFSFGYSYMHFLFEYPYI